MSPVKAVLIYAIIVGSLYRVDYADCGGVGDMPAQKVELTTDRVKTIIRQCAEAEGVDDIDKFCRYMLALGEAETGIACEAVGKDGEKGIWQIMDYTREYYNYKKNKNYSQMDMEDPVKCCEVATYYFNLCLKKHKRYDRSVMAYNTGINRKKMRNIKYYYRVIRRLK